MPTVELTHIIVPEEVHRDPEDLQGRIQAIIYRFEGVLCTNESLDDMFREVNRALDGYEADYTVTLNLTGSMRARISHKAKSKHKYAYVLERVDHRGIETLGVNSHDNLNALLRGLLHDLAEAR